MTPLLELADVARWFDVSPPWLTRAIERRPRAILKAVERRRPHAGEGREPSDSSANRGCGKSTVARLIVGLYVPTRGTIRYNGETIAGTGAPQGAAAMRRLRRGMQMIFQDPYASLNPRWRVRDVVVEPLRAQAPGSSAGELDRRAARAA